MMKKTVMVFLMVAMLFCYIAPATASESQMKISYYSEQDESVQEVRDRHPNITFVCDTLSANTTDELISAFLTGSFDFDIFPLFTSTYDVSTIIDKGYLADLSEYPGIKMQVERMYPDIQNLVVREDKVYGLPVGITFDFLSYDPEVWEAAGLTVEDVPSTFGEFLDFLESWVEWNRSGANEKHFVISDSFSEDLYNETSYTAYLTELLLNSYMMQHEYAGTVLEFSSNEFRRLLARCKEVGEKLYEIEKNPLAGQALLNNGMAASMKYLLSMRITPDQPKLIKAYVSILAAYTDSEQQEISAELAMKLLERNSLNAYLYKDALPVRDPSFDDNVAIWQKKIDDLQGQIDNADSLSAEAKAKLLDDLDRYKAVLMMISAPENEFLISQEDLDIYKQYADSIYIQNPGVFALGTENGQMVTKLIDRYAAGLVTVDQFIQRLDEVAWMIQMEIN